MYNSSLIKNVIALFMTVICISGCNQDKEQVEILPVIEGEISLYADKDEIRGDGSDAVTFTVKVTAEDGEIHDVTNHAEIYCNTDKKPLETASFSTDKEGTFVFYAVYGLSVSNEVSVSVFNDMPELPADPQESSTSFRHRMLLVQHTGATCSNCPRMMESLKTLSQDDSYNGLYHHVASHSYNGGEADDAYSEAARDLSMAYNVSGLYPMLTYNLTTVSTGTDLSEIRAQIDALKKDKADVGIAAAVKVSGDDVLVNVEVKAAKANSYRVAAWLLEDGIYSLQSGMSESWHNTHDNALRYAAGKAGQLSFVGDRLGELASGEKASKMFVLPVEKEWKKENCEVLVFVTSADENGNYDIANCTLCQIGETVSYEYK